MAIEASETNPLLSSTSPEHAEEAEAGNVKLFAGLFVDSVPVIFSYILQNSVQTIAVLVAGRLGPDALSVSAFSYMLAFVTGWCVALGGTTALDTFGSQAYTGGLQRSDVSIHFQRCLTVLWIMLIPVCCLWAFIEPILLTFGQEPVLSKDVQSFLRVLIVGAPGYIAFESLKKYLQCQGIMRLSTLVLVIVSPINVILNIALVHHTSLGILGSPLAISIIYWLAFILLAIFTAVSPQHKKNRTWGGWHLREVLEPTGICNFLGLALPGILMVGTEWAAFEIVALAAGRLGRLSLSAQSVIMTTDQILNTLPFGIGNTPVKFALVMTLIYLAPQGVSASARVGNLIGARSAGGAKRAGHAAALLSVVVGTIVMVSMMSVKDVYGYIFSDDEDVVSLIAKVMPLVASFQVADGLAGSCGGVLRGQGRQHLGALFNLVAYYVLALPLGITLAFHPRIDLGLQGLWVGQVIALFIVGFGEYGVVWLGTDWDKEVLKGIKRNREDARRREELLTRSEAQVEI